METEEAPISKAATMCGTKVTLISKKESGVVCSDSAPDQSDSIGCCSLPKGSNYSLEHRVAEAEVTNLFQGSSPRRA
jgi:hypothetical protein